jgi:hypothetical protein
MSERSVEQAPWSPAFGRTLAEDLVSYASWELRQSGSVVVTGTALHNANLSPGSLLLRCEEELRRPLGVAPIFGSTRDPLERMDAWRYSVPEAVQS